MSAKKSENRIKIIAIVVLVILLAGVIYFLEKGLPRRSSPRPAPPASAKKAFDTGQLIRGCLFELGIERDQVIFSNHHVTVRTGQKFSRGRLKAAFLPIEAYGRVEINDTSRVRISVAKDTWEIEFIQILPGKEPRTAIPEKYPEAKPMQTPATEPDKSLGRLAIIIDDVGDSLQKAQRMAAINGELTFSILPQQQYSKEIATFLHEKGRQILLHLPMQGHKSKDPGKGAIYKDMNPELVRTILVMDLGSVPYVNGVNNHMGSQITPRHDLMLTICQELKWRGLFFIDSLTSSKSVALKVARECEVPSAARDIFLDNNLTDAYITGQLAKLKNIARKYPCAIGIGHQHPQTIAVLEREIPRLKREGFRLVPVSTFVKP